MGQPARITISAQIDVELARAEARRLCAGLEWDRIATEQVLLATMELASNVLRYAPGGAMIIQRVEGPKGMGIELCSRDKGPGISDPKRALEDGYSTGGGLGGGLPAVRRLMDSFDLVTGPAGTVITARKWRP